MGVPSHKGHHVCKSLLEPALDPASMHCSVGIPGWAYIQPPLCQSIYGQRNTSSECGVRQPVVVRSPLDVFGLNRRCLLAIDSAKFGRVACAVIGALQVGSIRLKVTEGDRLTKVGLVLACPTRFVL